MYKLWLHGFYGPWLSAFQERLLKFSHSFTAQSNLLMTRSVITQYYIEFDDDKPRIKSYYKLTKYTPYLAHNVRYGVSFVDILEKYGHARNKKLQDCI